MREEGPRLGNASHFSSADHTSPFLSYPIKKPTSQHRHRQTLPSHRRTRQNRRIRHAIYAYHGRPSHGISGPAQRTTLPLNLSRYVLPCRHLTVSQVNVFRVFRHAVAQYMAYVCIVDAVDIAASTETTTTPCQTFFELDLLVMGAWEDYDISIPRPATHVVLALTHHCVGRMCEFSPTRRGTMHSCAANLDRPSSTGV